MATVSDQNPILKEKKTIDHYDSNVNVTAILQPVMSHRWRLAVDTFKYPADNEFNILTLQALNCSFNYVKREVVLTIQQSYNGDEHLAILQLCGNTAGFSPRFDLLNGNDNIISVQ